jgi:hypothetical protein
LDAAGRKAGAIVVRQPRRPVTQAMRDSLLALWLAALKTRTGEPLIDPDETERIARETPAADSLPAITSLRVAPDGVLWAFEDLAMSDSVWTAIGFRRDGSIAGRLTGPRSAWPAAIGRDRVVVIHRNTDGVVTLRVHPIQTR